jgi:hypothetical protein
MPITLTWNEPASSAIGYLIYRRQGTGSIDKNVHFLASVGASPLSYDDVTYDREVLQELGYTYAISALGPAGEGQLSDSQFITQTFDQPIYDETWDVTINGTLSPQFAEEWEFTLSLTPNELYVEDWEPLITEGPTGFAWVELWEKKEISDPGDPEYFEDWGFTDITDPGMSEYTELWEGPAISDPGDLEYTEDWEAS